MSMGGSRGARWVLLVQRDQQELFEVLCARLEGSGVEVVLERRQRERRRGSLGPAMDRRVGDRRRQRPVALIAPAAAAAPPAVLRAAGPEAASAPSPDDQAATHRCPTCAAALELELPRFPHPPARVEIQIWHVGANGQRAQHFVEIAAFTVSGRILVSQRIPARLRR